MRNFKNKSSLTRIALKHVVTDFMSRNDSEEDIERFYCEFVMRHTNDSIDEIINY